MECDPAGRRSVATAECTPIATAAAAIAGLNAA